MLMMAAMTAMMLVSAKFGAIALVFWPSLVRMILIVPRTARARLARHISLRAAANSGPFGLTPFVKLRIHTSNAVNLKLTELGTVWPVVKHPIAKIVFRWPCEILATAAKFIKRILRSSEGVMKGGRVMTKPLMLPLPFSWYSPLLGIPSLTMAAMVCPRRAVSSMFLQQNLA